MGPLCFDFGFGPFRWYVPKWGVRGPRAHRRLGCICVESWQQASDDIKRQYLDNLRWIESAETTIGGYRRQGFPSDTGTPIPAITTFHQRWSSCDRFLRSPHDNVPYGQSVPKQPIFMMVVSFSRYVRTELPRCPSGRNVGRKALLPVAALGGAGSREWWLRDAQGFAQMDSDRRLKSALH